MAVLIAKKTGLTIFILGLLAMVIMSFLGLFYLSQMAYSSNNNCDNLNTTQRNLARMGIVGLWGMVAWIIVGSVLQFIWKGVLY